MDYCNLCSESKDIDELIEVKDSMIRLKTGIVYFCKVLSEVFGISKTDHLVHICFKCKEEIVKFYNFKVKVKPNLNTLDEEKMKIVEKVQEFLLERTETMALIRETDNAVSILPVLEERSHNTNTIEIKAEDFNPITEEDTTLKTIKIESPVMLNLPGGCLKRRHDGTITINPSRFQIPK